ncbi:MAG: heavy metal-associated domain-containing protein [Candidatus Buchananbacteria bacterium]
MNNFEFKITNFHCDACVTLAKKVLEKISGIINIDVNRNGLVKVESDRIIGFEEIKSSLEAIDQKAETLS